MPGRPKQVESIRFLCEMEPACTSATPASFVGDARVDDGMVAEFRFPNGGTAMLDNT
jgi:hypothetical protein